MSAQDARLRDVASSGFVLLRSASAADLALATLTAADGAIADVIVDGGAPDRWYLLARQATSVLLAIAPAGMSVDDALGLSGRPATPILDGGLPASAAPAAAIVMDGGRLLGFIGRPDAEEPPSQAVTVPTIDAPASRSLSPGAVAAPTAGRSPPPLTGRTPPPPAGAEVPRSAGPSRWRLPAVRVPWGRTRAEPPEHGARAEPPDDGARAEPPDVGAMAEPPEEAGGAPVRRGGVLEALAADDAPAAGAAVAGAAADPVRSLEAEFPEHVRLGSVAWLLVYITQQAATSHGLGLHVAAGETIDIVVQARAGFALDGGDRGTLEVPASGESLPFQFKLKATVEGSGAVRVLAFHKGEPLGDIMLSAVVDSATVPLATGAPPAAARVSARLATPSPRVPDMTIFVEEWKADETSRYRILLSATDPSLDLNLETFGPYELKLDPAAFFAGFFREIDALPLDTPAQRDAADRRLAEKGAYLADTLLPEDLREKLWAVRDRIGSIVVQSEEPWIPWELCRLTGRDGDRVVEGPYLCEAYAITRWLPGTGFKRPLSLRNLALVVPGDSALPLAAAERDYMLSLATADRAVTSVDATYATVQDAFRAGVYDGWHFTGHGAARDGDADTSAIVLAGGDLLTPESISGAAANVGLPHPIVFFNACQVGRSGMALTGIGGWASRFVQAGAGAFIGAYWSVIDEPAFDFARAVYGRLLAGVPVGEAVRDARIAIRTPGDPTWLAYTVFADPLAVIDGGGG
jgi:hypothetical protein